MAFIMTDSSKNLATLDSAFLEEIYEEYNRRETTKSDPLHFLYRYQKNEDVEIAGLIASSLAYGRTSQICKSVGLILDKMKSPYDFITGIKSDEFSGVFRGFKHRFTTEAELVELLISTKSIVEQYGSLESCFMSGYGKADETVYPALRSFAARLLNSRKRSSLIPMPEGKSAFKRLNLYLRWMVRSDDIDTGIWKDIPTSKLIIPLDTHTHRAGLYFSLTKRKQNDIKTALEITSALKKLNPDDPVKYDFALTRYGINNKQIMESSDKSK